MVTVWSAIRALVRNLLRGDDLVVVSRYLPPAISYDDTYTTVLEIKFSVFHQSFGKILKPTDIFTIYRGFDVKIAKYPEF
ncbi:MAG: hypothetical protein CM15mP93_16720 [Thiotrichaceae bacterium]|nr:MAG: hypothetical protein CM15mP93_16720 [Thiotrichaceae bacterium]